jgi:hypothetical protein
VEEVEVVVAHHERATLRVGAVFLKINADHGSPREPPRLGAGASSADHT